MPVLPDGNNECPFPFPPVPFQPSGNSKCGVALSHLAPCQFNRMATMSAVYPFPYCLMPDLLDGISESCVLIPISPHTSSTRW